MRIEFKMGEAVLIFIEASAAANFFAMSASSDAFAMPVGIVASTGMASKSVRVALDCLGSHHLRDS